MKKKRVCEKQKSMSVCHNLHEWKERGDNILSAENTQGEDSLCLFLHIFEHNSIFTTLVIELIKT